MKGGTTWLFLACLLASSTACKPQAKHPERARDEVYFNQTLLREAAPYLEDRFDVRIEISSELREVEDLWVDYQTGDKKESIDQILDGIAAAISRDHGLSLAVERVDAGKGTPESYRLKLVDGADP